jgi:hypothetical protein
MSDSYSDSFVIPTPAYTSLEEILYNPLTLIVTGPRFKTRIADAQIGLNFPGKVG